MLRVTQSTRIDALIRVYDDAGNVIVMHEHKGDFQRALKVSCRGRRQQIMSDKNSEQDDTNEK